MDVPTAPLSDEQLKTVSKNKPRYFPPQFSVGCAQSIGKQRDHNEDTLYSFNAVLADGDSAESFGLFIIADGMGGHEHGEEASSLATRVMSEYVLAHFYLPMMSRRNGENRESLQEVMEGAVVKVQERVEAEVPGGGTTLTAALLIGDRLTYAHVGDSRAYYISPDGVIEAITNDHSLVKRLIELGQLTPEQAATHPQRNVLYRAIGQLEPFQPDVETRPFESPAMLLLCSDGLWGVVSDREIYQIINSAKNIQQACDELVKAANAAGGPDNISVILVQT